MILCWQRAQKIRSNVGIEIHMTQHREARFRLHHGRSGGRDDRGLRRRFLSSGARCHGGKVASGIGLTTGFGFGAPYVGGVLPVGSGDGGLQRVEVGAWLGPPGVDHAEQGMQCRKTADVDDCIADGPVDRMARSRERPTTSELGGASRWADSRSARCDGCIRSSSSWKKTQSPVATATPELRAALGPSENLWRTTSTSGNSLASMASVSSVEASSTTMISMSRTVCARTPKSARRNSDARLRVGMMMLTLFPTTAPTRNDITATAGTCEDECGYQMPVSSVVGA